MKSLSSQITLLAAGALFAGCASDPNRVGLTNPHQPGPAAGRAAGSAVGAVGGNVAGAVVGFGEGVAAGAATSFDNTRRVVRVWRNETTADGRVIKVPVDIEVDRYGRPLGAPPAPATVTAPPAPAPK
ncbi:MAG: flagellar motor protein MotB [Verrucomicrobia bacterium]|nr:flagellar motor protein MotB [Verrucomicrobiota bacterium]